MAKPGKGHLIKKFPVSQQLEVWAGSRQGVRVAGPGDSKQAQCAGGGGRGATGEVEKPGEVLSRGAAEGFKEDCDVWREGGAASGQNL